MDLSELIQAEADHCVKCGLCLPHCPTYQKTRDEGDSPRGRIALMQGLAADRLAAEGRLEWHLDRCLACRACERACPSGVRYGRLIVAARALIRQRRGPRRLPWAEQLLARPRQLRAAARAARLYQRSGLQRLARRSGLLRLLKVERLDRTLPAVPRPAPRRHDYYPPTGQERGRVALFTGCLGELFEREALDAATGLLNHCGYGVHVPTAQSCCGALPLHRGDVGAAAGLARRNREAFDALAVDAIVYTASGCGAALAEYGAGFPGIDGAQALRAPVIDAASLLARIPWPDTLAFRPLAARVAVHDPCTLTNVARAGQPPYSLLARIPDLDLQPLPGNRQCCGAAGSYMLNQPEMADALRTDKLAALRELRPDILLTSNVGCALHLAAGIREAGLKIEVMHPVTLLWRQLEQS